MTTSIGAVIIVVPVHNEAELLERCLTALGHAVAETSLPCVVRIVLDACDDESATIAAQHTFPLLALDANAVGAARAHGVASALRALDGLNSLPPERIWIAGTDADSAVPANWLTTQRELADDGADVVLGSVRPDFDDLSESHREHWLRTHTHGAPNGNTHGANLGVRASTYISVGGFPSLPRDEDVQLVDACRAAGAVVVASDVAEVMTSGRLEGRAPGGYASFVREMAGHFAPERATTSPDGETR